jgi:hypothetical protein
MGSRFNHRHLYKYCGDSFRSRAKQVADRHSVVVERVARLSEVNTTKQISKTRTPCSRVQRVIQMQRTDHQVLTKTRTHNIAIPHRPRDHELAFAGSPGQVIQRLRGNQRHEL